MCDVQNEIVNIDGDELVLQGTAAKAVTIALELEKYNAKGNNEAMGGGNPALLAAIVLQGLVNTAPAWVPNAAMLVGAFIGVGGLAFASNMASSPDAARWAAQARWAESPEGRAALAKAAAAASECVGQGCRAAARAAALAAECAGKECASFRFRGGAVNDKKCLVKFRNSSFQVSSVIGDAVRKLSSMGEDESITYLSSLINEFKSDMNNKKKGSKGGRKTRRRRN